MPPGFVEAPYSGNGRKPATQTLNRERARDLGEAMPALLARIARALKMPSLPGRQELDFEVWTRQITATFKAIGEAVNAEATNEFLYEQLIERTDRLRELIEAANVALDRLVGERDKPKVSNQSHLQ